ncbi:5-aminovalerate aminotransferase DavT [compost metagenome]
MIEAFEEEKLLDRAKSVGEILTAGLRQIGEKYTSVLEVRNLGAMVAVELCEAGDSNKPAAELTGKIVARARDKGLILLSCGTYYNVLRILVPLTVSDADLERGLRIIGECFDELA